MAALPTATSFNHVSAPAVDAAGDTFIAYTDNSAVWVVERPAGASAFGPPLRVASSAALSPQLAADAAGDLVVAWLGLYKSGGKEDIVPYVATISGGVITFSGAPLSVPAETGKFATYLAVATDPAGAAAVAWVEPGAQELAQVVTRGSPGQALGSLTNVGAIGPSGPTAQNVTSLALSVDGVGNVVLAYTQAGELLEITGPQWPPAPNRLSGDTSSRPPAVASSGANTIVAWADESAHPYFIDASLALGSTPGGVLLSAPKILHGVFDAIATPPPAVAIDANGDAVVAWQESGSGNAGLRAAVRPAGGAFSLSELDVSDQFALDLGRVASITPAGVALVGWGYDPESGPVHDAEARTIAMSGSLGPITVLDTHDSEGSLTAAAAPDGAGEPVFAWERFPGSNVEVAAYDTVPPTLEAISGPSSIAVGVSASFSVATPFDIWSPPALVSWSFGDGGGAAGPTATHVYSAPGSYTVTATATDALGNATARSAQIAVTAPSIPATRHCVVPPLKHLSLRAAKSRLSTAACKAGTIKHAHHRSKHAKHLSYGVVAQSPPPAVVEPLGAPVDIKLGWFKPHKRVPRGKHKHKPHRHL